MKTQEERIGMYDKESYHTKRIDEPRYQVLADAFLQHAQELLHKSAENMTAFDIGCSTGELLMNMKQIPNKQKAGCDISKIGLSHAEQRVPGAEFFRVDLDDPASCGVFWDFWDKNRYIRHANIVSCLEVAEHIQYSMDLIYLISRIAYSSDSILFLSAAPPGQPGRGHINCQPPQYWANRLAVFGWKEVPSATSELHKCISEKIDPKSCYLNTRVYVR